MKVKILSKGNVILINKSGKKAELNGEFWREFFEDYDNKFLIEKEEMQRREFVGFDKNNNKVYVGDTVEFSNKEWSIVRKEDGCYDVIGINPTIGKGSSIVGFLQKTVKLYDYVDSEELLEKMQYGKFKMSIGEVKYLTGILEGCKSILNCAKNRKDNCGVSDIAIKTIEEKYNIILYYFTEYGG